MCFGFQARSNVDGITIKVVLGYHDIADIDADAEHHPLFFWYIFIHGLHFALHLNRTLGGLEGAWKFGDHTVAGAAENGAAVFSDHTVDHQPALLQ